MAWQVAERIKAACALSCALGKRLDKVRRHHGLMLPDHPPGGRRMEAGRWGLDWTCYTHENYEVRTECVRCMFLNVGV